MAGVRWLLWIPLVVALWLTAQAALFVFNGLASGTWKTTAGRIVESGDRLEYRFRIRDHEGRDREAVAHQLAHSFWRPQPEELARRYPVGAEVTVHYTTSPQGATVYSSVLETGLRADAVVVLVVALAIAWGCWRGFRRPRATRHGAGKWRSAAD